MATSPHVLIIDSKMNNNNIGYCEANLKEVLTDCLGRKDLLIELVGIFKKNIQEFIENTAKHLQKKDIKGVGFTSHKIKTSLKMMRIDHLYQIATEMDAICKKQGDMAHLNFLFNQFLSEYPMVEKTIDEQLKNIN